MLELFGESSDTSLDSWDAKPRTPGAGINFEALFAKQMEKPSMAVSIPRDKIPRAVIAHCQLLQGIRAQVVERPGEPPQLQVPEESWALPCLSRKRWDRSHRNRSITVDEGMGETEMSLWEAYLRGYFMVPTSIAQPRVGKENRCSYTNRHPVPPTTTQLGPLITVDNQVLGE